MFLYYFLDSIKIVKNILKFILGDRILTNGGKYFYLVQSYIYLWFSNKI